MIIYNNDENYHSISLLPLLVTFLKDYFTIKCLSSLLEIY